MVESCVPSLRVSNVQEATLEILRCGRFYNAMTVRIVSTRRKGGPSLISQEMVHDRVSASHYGTMQMHWALLRDVECLEISLSQMRAPM